MSAEALARNEEIRKKHMRLGKGNREWAKIRSAIIDGYNLINYFRTPGLANQDLGAARQQLIDRW